MDMVSHPGQQSAAPAPAAAGQAKMPVQKGKRNRGEGFRILNVILLVMIAIIVGLLAVYTAIGGDTGEKKYVDKTKFQAVFLNGGQVYFGKVQALNEKFITLNNIYYLRVNQQVQPNQSTTSSANQDVSLAKLGCELHGPTDVMVINREQVLFWENLKADGQVTKAITAYVKANPQGQTCETTSDSSTTPSSSTTTPTTTTPTTKK